MILINLLFALSYLIVLYLLVLFIPSLIISRIANKLGNNLTSKCQGRPGMGRYIGYAERSLIYIFFLIVLLNGNNLANATTALTLIIAGKGLFRLSGETPKECAEWFILGTFLSILLGTFITWLGLMPIKYMVNLW